MAKYQVSSQKEVRIVLSQPYPKYIALLHVIDIKLFLLNPLIYDICALLLNDNLSHSILG